jgi:hypothetical protein
VVNTERAIKKKFDEERYFDLKDKGYYYLVSELKYHTLWDWLMPVLEKIESLRLGYFKYYYTWSFYNSNGNCLWYKNNNEKGIMNLFFEVVEFIKWYNENKQV